MGRSQTVHCLGFARMDDQSERVYLAMNRVEIAQMRIEAERDGYTIGHWIAQTKTGVRILGPKCDGVQCAVADADVPRARVVECSICNGRGVKPGYRCPVCRGAGITAPNHWKKWRTWQLDEFRAEFSTD